MYTKSTDCILTEFLIFYSDILAAERWHGSEESSRLGAVVSNFLFPRDIRCKVRRRERGQVEFQGTCTGFVIFAPNSDSGNQYK